jgi:hypothetical protein
VDPPGIGSLQGFLDSVRHLAHTLGNSQDSYYYKWPGTREEKLFRSMAELHLKHLNKAPMEDKPIPTSYEAAEMLFSLLVSRKGFWASDPRDILFANVGLLPKPPSNDPLLHLRAVDYEKNEAQVLTDLARYFLANLGESILSLLDGAPGFVKNLPSWVPDWTSASDLPYVPRNEALRRHPMPARWGYRPPIWALNSHIFAITGAVCAKVSELSTTIATVSGSRSRIKEIYDLVGRWNWTEFELWEIVREVFEQTYEEWKHILGPTRDPRRVIDAFHPLIEFPYENCWTIPETQLVDDISRSFNSLVSVISRGTDYQRAKVLNRVWLGTERFDICYTGGDIQSLLSQIALSSLLAPTNVLHSRRFAHLDGDRLALVPGSTRIGDVVALFIRDSQLNSLIVLRPYQEKTDPLLDAEIKQEYESIMMKFHLVLNRCPPSIPKLRR